MFTSTQSVSCPAATRLVSGTASIRPRASPRATRGPKAPQALPAVDAVISNVHSVVYQLAAADPAPGSVDAPIGAIIGGAVVVTLLSFLVSSGLKSGTDAAAEMQQRDSKKWKK